MATTMPLPRHFVQPSHHPTRPSPNKPPPHPRPPEKPSVSIREIRGSKPSPNASPHPPLANHPLGPKGQPIPAWGIAPGKPQQKPQALKGRHNISRVITNGERTFQSVAPTKEPRTRPPFLQTRRPQVAIPSMPPPCLRAPTPPPGSHFAVQGGALWPLGN